MYNIRTLIRSSYRSIPLFLKSMSVVTQNNPIENSIRKKLVDFLNPSHIEVINESYMHNVPKGSETHFKVVVVSNTFVDKSRIKRHQMINNLLRLELESSVHALSIVAKTCSEWEDNNKIAPSPACRSGFGK